MQRWNQLPLLKEKPGFSPAQGTCFVYSRLIEAKHCTIVHPDTARDLHLRDGDMVAVETPKGSIKMRLKTSEDMAPQVVSAPHGWPQAPINILTDLSLCEPILGQPEFNAILCRLRKV